MSASHPKRSSLLCGLCLTAAASYEDLSSHLEGCRMQHGVESKYVCKICCYHDDDNKLVENHVAVHNFVIASCRAQGKMFNPADYVEINSRADFPEQVGF